MSEFKDGERMTDTAGGSADHGSQGLEEQAEVEPNDSADGAGNGEPAAEAEILRSELMRLQEELRDAKAQVEEMKDRFMRARADLENYRKRSAADAERARDAGLDSAVLPMLTVFDDLRRAMDAADSSDPASIVPGVQSVLATLERNLGALGIKSIGNIGDSFDPDLHEALTSVPTDETEKSETIAEVFQLGFQKGDRLIRPARVVVYQS